MKIAYDYWNKKLINEQKWAIFPKVEHVPFKLVKQFLLCQYSCANNSVKIHYLNVRWKEGECVNIVCRTRCQSWSSYRNRENHHECWNNRNWLMSKKEQFFQKSIVPFQLIYQFLLFQYSSANNPVNWEICRLPERALERVRGRKYCV